MATWAQGEQALHMRMGDTRSTQFLGFVPEEESRGCHCVRGELGESQGYRCAEPAVPRYAACTYLPPRQVSTRGPRSAQFRLAFHRKYL